MAEIVARIPEASEAMNTMKTQQGVIVEKNAAILRMVESVQDEWNSTSGNAFRETYNQINAVLQRMASTVAEGVAKFELVLKQYDEAENENVNTAQSTFTAFAEGV